MQNSKCVHAENVANDANDANVYVYTHAFLSTLGMVGYGYACLRFGL